MKESFTQYLLFLQRHKISISFIVLFVTIAIVIYTTYTTLLFAPPIWPDEEMFADVANNLLHIHVLGTNIWATTVPGITHCACWYPPLFFYLLAGTFSLFGFSIEVQRLLSVTAFYFFSLASFLFMYDIVRFYNNKYKKDFLWIIPFFSSAIIIDYFLFFASHISRPEIFILCFGMFGLYFYQKIYITNSPSYKKFYVYISGLLFGLTLLIHIMAFFWLPPVLISAIILMRGKMISRNMFLSFLCILFLPFALWLLLSGKNVVFIWIQYHLLFSEKPMDFLWLLGYLFGAINLIFLLHQLYFLVTVFLIFYSIKYQRAHPLLLIVLVLLSSWIFCFRGEEFWYYVYIVPFVYLGIFNITIDLTIRYKNMFLFRIIILTLFCILFYINISLYFNWSQVSNNTSYWDFGSKVEQVIPAHKVVFLSSIPDMYYEFKKYRKDISVYKFPDFPISAEKYQFLLSKCDYIIINGTSSPFLQKYISVNQQKTMYIRSGYYNVTIIMLKPIKQRRSIN